MTQPQQDPAHQWSGQLARLDGTRRDAVIAALRHSADTGWPASGDAVELLVSYAVGDITAREYSGRMLQVLYAADRGVETFGVPASWRPQDVAAAPEPSTVRPSATVSREDAVHAYVTGQIPVGEFLRLARG